MKNKVLKYMLGLVAFCMLMHFESNAQSKLTPINDQYVQVTGVTMMEDKSGSIPNVTVLVKGRNIGVNSNYDGVFSLICAKGDTLEFYALSYKHATKVIPGNFEGKFYTYIQNLEVDTFYLPETIITNELSARELEYAFAYHPVPDDDYFIMQRNLSNDQMMHLMQTLPHSSAENQQLYQLNEFYNNSYMMQQKPVGLFNPLAWGDFFKSWKRGDFKKK